MLLKYRLDGTAGGAVIEVRRTAGQKEEYMKLMKMDADERFITAGTTMKMDDNAIKMSLNHRPNNYAKKTNMINSGQGRV